ncbi:hypothetical protein ACIBEJ_01480 [Nonomuraea sp. NPDC050790]|uniref:hypothetical protein n=1 Tax=Nonomuraea sp. NPDC050790 TaxID=3364371 RepID=UPI0037945B6F
MDPVTLVVTALAAGAALGLKDTASVAVKDAYEALKGLARRRLGERPDGELALDRHERAPDTWRAPLLAELAAAGAEGDGELVAAARALLELAGEDGARAYAVDARGSQGVQVGDHNQQANVFHAPQKP